MVEQRPLRVKDTLKVSHSLTILRVGYFEGTAGGFTRLAQQYNFIFIIRVGDSRIVDFTRGLKDGIAIVLVKLEKTGILNQNLISEPALIQQIPAECRARRPAERAIAPSCR